MASRDVEQRGWRHAWGVPSRAEKWRCIFYTPSPMRLYTAAHSDSLSELAALRAAGVI
jgi:hypothetical protein